MLLNVNVPLLPMNPIFLPPEQAVQLDTRAWPPIVLVAASASNGCRAGGGVGPGPAASPSNVTVAGEPDACEVTNTPASCVSACPGTVAGPTAIHDFPSKE